MTREEQMAVLGVQAEIGAIASLALLVRAGAEAMEAHRDILGALDGLHAAADSLAERMDRTTGLYPLA